MDRAHPEAPVPGGRPAGWDSRYHDCTTSMTDLTGPWPGKSTAGLPVEVVCHGDLAPYNLVYRGGSPIGIIDFDNGAPGSRIEDLAYFAYRTAPLSAESNYRDAGWPPDVDRYGRLRTILDVYGDLDRADMLPEIAVLRLAEMVGWIRARAERGDPSVAVHVKENHIGIYQADMAWIRANAGQLRATIAG
jgi:Ser/Thr protein kinase RdoA (MazF antagonist)